MEENSLVNYLTNFGLSRQESSIYLSLQSNGEMTGYEVAKSTGISRSGVYTALESLVDKGAVYIIEGSVMKYTPVSFEDFSRNFIKDLTNKQKQILKYMPVRKKDTGRYITIKGKKNILDKISNMLTDAECRIYISVPTEILELYENELVDLINNNKKVVILTNEQYHLDNALIYYKPKIDHQIRLIVDSVNVLTGTLSDDDNSTCLYSNNQNLVDVFKEMLQNEITLIELNKIG